MDESRARSWVRTAKKLGVSAFLIVHLGGTVVWVLPPCPVRAACVPWAQYYMMPLGFWQYWGMFAPDPLRDTVTMEADVVDARGLRSTFEFTKVANLPKLQAVPKFRHPKYVANLLGDDAQFDREVAARHAVRRLEIPDEAFPVDVNLIAQIRRTPPPGSPPADAMTPAQPVVLATFHFSEPGEVRR